MRVAISNILSNVKTIYGSHYGLNRSLKFKYSDYLLEVSLDTFL